MANSERRKPGKKGRRIGDKQIPGNDRMDLRLSDYDEQVSVSGSAIQVPGSFGQDFDQRWMGEVRLSPDDSLTLFRC